MKLQFLQPTAELRPYINKLWLLESEQGLVSNKSLIAPNGRPKIMIPFRNSLATTDKGRTEICREQDVCFIGIRDVPVTLSSSLGATGSIGIELTTIGGYRFSNISMHEFTNRLFSFAEIFGKQGRELLELMMNNESPQKKIAIIQNFLVKQLREENKNNFIVDYCINNIIQSHGLVEIKELERKTGYSKRYLDMLFKDHLGISPKTFSTIQRFQRFYATWQKNTGVAQEGSLYDLYYDQSHFIKEFKRYTGYSPNQYIKLNNDFGKNF
jgi:AraC-like DNA-binding protein